MTKDTTQKEEKKLNTIQEAIADIRAGKGCGFVVDDEGQRE